MKRLIVSVFLLYFFSAVALPAYHSHDANDRHFHPFPQEGCCEIHGKTPTDRNNHPAHLQTEDAAFLKSRHSDKSTISLKWLAFTEIAHFIKMPLSRDFLTFGIKNYSQWECFTFFSGLSPPKA